MYKMNLLLKFIIVILTIALVVIINNRIILWLLLVLLTFYNLLKNKKLLLIDFVLVILLGLSTSNIIYLLLFKILFIFNYLITVYKGLTTDEKKILVRENSSAKIDYFEKSFERVVKNINEKKIGLYDDELSIDKKIEKDLERSYLQARIRYYGLSNNKWYNWNRIDTLVLLLFLVIFVIMFILR